MTALEASLQPIERYALHFRQEADPFHSLVHASVTSYAAAVLGRGEGEARPSPEEEEAEAERLEAEKADEEARQVRAN